MVRCDFWWIALNLCILSFRRRRFIVNTVCAVILLSVGWVVLVVVPCYCSAFAGCVVRHPGVLLCNAASVVEVEETMQTRSLFAKAGLCAEMRGDRWLGNEDLDL